MTFWEFLDKRWPGERQTVTGLLAVLIAALLQMAADNPGLWDVELFKTLLTAAVITGALNMVLSFHFAANKADETKSENTARAFEAITATANASGSGEPTKPDVTLQPGETAQAAPEKP